MQPFAARCSKELADDNVINKVVGFHLLPHIDWYREDAPWGRTGRGTGRPTEGRRKSYYTFMNNQLTELLTNYGPIGAIRFDGWWDQDANLDFDRQPPEQYALIHRLATCFVW